MEGRERCWVLGVSRGTYVPDWEPGSVSFWSEPGQVKGLLMAGEDVGRRNQDRRSGFGHMRSRCSRAQGQDIGQRQTCWTHWGTHL